jgi:signal transduction histidine kinase
MAENSELTMHPAAQRASTETLDRQARSLRHLPYAEQFLDTTAAIVLILNMDRQIVFASRQFREMMKSVETDDGASIETYFGRRPGEALQCIHRDETPVGCGTSEFCSVCGAAKAIICSQLGRETVQECRLRRRGTTGVAEALDLRIWGRPLDIDGERFIMLTVQDISDEKHRQTLERIFFHDVLNTAGGLHGLAQILADTNMEEDQVRHTADLLCYSSQQLIDEIQAHRTLKAAEHNDLVPQPGPVEVCALLNQIAETFAAHDLARKRFIFVVPGEVHAETDKMLLGRVVINLVKNALEASEAGQTVTLNAWQEDQWAIVTVRNQLAMPKDVQLQIFNRSFSTRGSGRGVGTYSAKLITEHYLHGTLTFQSSQPEGTICKVAIPLEFPG